MSKQHMNPTVLTTVLILLTTILPSPFRTGAARGEQPAGDARKIPIPVRLAQYASVQLTADVSALTENERNMIPLLIEAASAMDDAFWI